MNTDITTPIVSALPKNPKRASGRIMLLRQGIKARIEASKKHASITLEDGRTFDVIYSRLHKNNPRFSQDNALKMNELFDWNVIVHDMLLFTDNHTVYHWECAHCHEHAIGTVMDMAEHLKTHGIDVTPEPDMTGMIFVLP